LQPTNHLFRRHFLLQALGLALAMLCLAVVEPAARAEEAEEAEEAAALEPAAVVVLEVELSPRAAEEVLEAELSPRVAVVVLEAELLPQEA
jgi:hypothetical protein